MIFTRNGSKRTRNVVIPALLGTLLCLTVTAQDAIRGEIERRVDNRILIAVPPPATTTDTLAGTARELREALDFDLTFTGLFKTLPPEMYPAGFVALPTNVQALDFTGWRATGAEYLVYSLIYAEGDQLVGEFRLFDLTAGNQVYGQQVRVDLKTARLAAHRFSEEVVRYVDGTPGCATSEIVFSGKTGDVKEIYVADYDGYNARKLTEHGSISIKPKISPDGNSVAYVSYKDRYSFLYVLDRRTGKTTPLSKEVGLNSAPSWSPDSRRVALTLSKDGNTEIYLRDPDGGNAVRLTKNRDGDTSPCFSPDGSKIAFVSDRAGMPQIFVMNADGSGQTRLSFHGGKAYDPVWSPDGTMIAFVSEIRGQGFEIYVMNADGSNPTQLTDSPGINESPSWSPDSRHVIFSSTRNGRSELYAVNVRTREEIKIPYVTVPAEGPSWGPRRR
ncbi:MAG TPA: Tol-Pal system beta propeller repeat protein TolB [Candidatus Hydrogenedentes bacterium]|nr:Tol-Pal system beta propeller repeat protein TolB [Candidatus Hydrogenedentota bacterium]